MLDFVVTEGKEETETTEPDKTEETETVNTPETESTQKQSIAIDFEQLLAQYPNAVGWLYCEGNCYITLSTCSYEYENARYVVIEKIKNSQVFT